MEVFGFERTLVWIFHRTLVRGFRPKLSIKKSSSPHGCCASSYELKSILAAGQMLFFMLSSRG